MLVEYVCDRFFEKSICISKSENKVFHFESVSSDNEFGFVIIYIADIVRIPKANILNILSKFVLLFIMLSFY